MKKSFVETEFCRILEEEYIYTEWMIVSSSLLKVAEKGQTNSMKEIRKRGFRRGKVWVTSLRKAGGNDLVTVLGRSSLDSVGD